jgi:hypothetical protein
MRDTPDAKIPDLNIAPPKKQQIAIEVTCWERKGRDKEEKKKKKKKKKEKAPQKKNPEEKNPFPSNKL